MRAIDTTRKPPVTTGAECTIREVARLMDRDAVGAVVVTDGDRPIGIVTDRDLVIRALARGVAGDARIDSVMSTDLVTMGATVDVREALRIFERGTFRRLPLVDAGRIVGILTLDDLLINEVGDLGRLTRVVTGQVVFGHPEAELPAVSG
jgi:CBS domain-containing protein